VKYSAHLAEMFRNQLEYPVKKYSLLGDKIFHAGTKNIRPQQKQTKSIRRANEIYSTTKRKIFDEQTKYIRRANEFDINEIYSTVKKN